MKVGDCFMMKGSTIDEPMTIYHITDIQGDNLWALSVCINDQMVQGLEYPNEYDNEIPEEAILLPEGTYDRVKACMKEFLDNVNGYLRDNYIEGTCVIEVGGHYHDEYIYSIKSIHGERAKYNLFRLETENISPYWTGEGNIDTISSYNRRITEETYQEVMRRYNVFVKNLRESLYNVK